MSWFPPVAFCITLNEQAAPPHSRIRITHFSLESLTRRSKKLSKRFSVMQPCLPKMAVVAKRLPSEGFLSIVTVKYMYVAIANFVRRRARSHLPPQNVYVRTYNACRPSIARFRHSPPTAVQPSRFFARCMIRRCMNGASLLPLSFQREI